MLLNSFQHYQRFLDASRWEWSVPGPQLLERGRGHGASRTARYQLQDEAGEALAGTVNPAENPFRVHNCLRVTTGSNFVIVLRGPNGRARYGNLQTCGSPWTCAVCAARIGRVREAEIQAAFDTHLASGAEVLQLTITHGEVGQGELAPLLDAYALATRWMTSLREYKGLLAALNYIGKVRGVETSWREGAGWRARGHELFFVGRGLGDDEMKTLRQGVSDIWERACARFGLPIASGADSVTIERATTAADYLAQAASDGGSAAQQVSSWQPNSSPAHRYTPFDLLRARAAGHRPQQMTALFHEYALACHGKRQLFWSQGLKAHFGITDINDMKAAQTPDAGHVIGGRIGREDWLRVTADSSRRGRLIVLERFERGGMAAVEAFIATLPAAPRAPRALSKTGRRAMQTHVFELNCDDSNIRPVEGPLASTGLDYSLMRTARGGYVLLLRSELAEDDVVDILSRAGIKVIKGWGVSL